MSGLLETGRQEVAERDAQDARDAEYKATTDREHMTRRFYMDFYRGRYRYDPEQRTYVAHDLPPIEFVIGDGGYRETTRFRCDGLTFEVVWKYKGGGDRAYWDDGWWPDWYVIQKRLLLSRRLGPVYRPEQLARVLA